MFGQQWRKTEVEGGVGAICKSSGEARQDFSKVGAADKSDISLLRW